MTMHYSPDGNKLTSAEWSAMFEARNTEGDDSWWRMRTTITDGEVAHAEVSTVWMGLDHNFTGEGPPLIFESMVFGGPLDQEFRRYPTWSAAWDGHMELCEVVALAVAVES